MAPCYLTYQLPVCLVSHIYWQKQVVTTVRAEQSQRGSGTVSWILFCIVQHRRNYWPSSVCKIFVTGQEMRQEGYAWGFRSQVEFALPAAQKQIPF